MLVDHRGLHAGGFAVQSTRVYSDFIAAVGKTQTEDMDYCAVSIVGPRSRVDKIVGKLLLMP
ncbi:DUF2000 family protein [Streptomyces sp. NPDC005708]|uniref:DUF2000 family protein n=1 Tax=Streptomyces sp. NPDC005708 TaxID=3154564 RepID=UPI003402C12A